MTDRPLTILHVTNDLFSLGGTPRKLLSLVQGTDRRFSHVFLLFDKHTGSLEDEVRHAGGEVIRVRRPRAYDVRLLWDIVATARACKADIVSTHFARADVYGAVAGTLVGKPVIKNVHGILWNASNVLRRLDRMLDGFRACTVCNSRATLGALRKQGKVRRGLVIWNGVPNRALPLDVDERAALRNRLGIPQDAFVVGHVGGLIPVRDQRTMIEAMALLKQQVEQCRLVIVGDGPLRRQLEELAATLHVRQNVDFLGYRDDVPALLNVFDAYVNVTLAEGFGIAVIEAMQSALPVVLANAGALPELVEDGKSGILVECGDVAGLASTLARLQADPKWAAGLGGAAATRAATNFSMEHFISAFESLYLNVAVTSVSRTTAT